MEKEKTYVIYISSSILDREREKLTFLIAGNDKKKKKEGKKRNTFFPYLNR